MVEYPGYGVYKANKCDKRMQQDSLIVFDFVCNRLGFQAKNVIIFGRSIGTGPATYLARHRPGTKLLILLSPYTNLKAVAKDFVSILSIMFRDRFRNIDHIQHITSPVIIIHGKKDEIIKCEHAEKLKNKCNSFCRLVTPPNMTHNYFRLFQDLIIPIKRFLEDIEKNNISMKKELGLDSDDEVIMNFDSLNLESLKFYKSDYLYQLEKQIIKSRTSENSSSWQNSSSKIIKKKKINSDNRTPNNEMIRNPHERNKIPIFEEHNRHKTKKSSNFEHKAQYDSPLKNNFNQNSSNPMNTKKPYYREKSPNITIFNQSKKSQ